MRFEDAERTSGAQEAGSTRSSESKYILEKYVKKKMQEQARGTSYRPNRPEAQEQTANSFGQNSYPENPHQFGSLAIERSTECGQEDWKI